MYTLLLLYFVAAASAVPHYLISEPAPAFSLIRIVERRPPTRVVSHGNTYFSPEQNLKKVVTSSAPVRVPAPQYTYKTHTTTPAPVHIIAPTRNYNIPAQVPVRVAVPIHTYNAPTTTSAPVRVAAPVRTYKAPATTPNHVRVVAPVRSYNAPAPAATYNALSVHEGVPVVPIIRDNKFMPDGGSGDYNFEFETGDGIIRSEQGGMTDHGIMKKGGWSFTYPDGTPAAFTFIADENGFRVVSDLLPVAPPMPAHALAQIERARLEDEAEARLAAAASAIPRSYSAPRNKYST